MASVTSVFDNIKNTLLRERRRNPAFLKVARVACIMLLLVLLYGVFGSQAETYLRHLGEKDYFGEHYNEIMHYAQGSDKLFAQSAGALIDAAFDFEGTAEEAEEKFGILARYCGGGEHSLNLVTASEEKGCLWITYSNAASKNVLVRFGITADGTVTDVMEHP